MKRFLSPDKVVHPFSVLFAGAVLVVLASGVFLAMTSAQSPTTGSKASTSEQNQPGDEEKELETATFGGGCFWCTEAFFKALEGVQSVKSGYSGGHVDNPTYRQVCTGETGHAEVIQVKFDPEVVSFADLLEVFWRTHDPTTLNRQGNDVGTQYRSVVFYHNDRQQEVAEKYKEKLDRSGAFDQPIVTEIAPFEKFYAAEDYHQDYFELNPLESYCQFIIRPKMEKFKKVFAEKLKDDSQ